MLTSTVVLLLLSVTTSVATSSSISGIRGKNRDLTEECGAFGTCNERSYCTDSGCQCKDGFKDPPYCQDRNECLETPSPCDFDGAVCVDEDPHLDGSPGGKYHCACNLKEGWVDGPDEPNDFGQTSCMRADQQHCPPSLDSMAADSFCETPASVNQSCSYKEECCCGECSASRICSCIDGEFRCLFTEACYSPSCLSEEQEALWDSLVGEAQCSDATKIISEDYPGMDVSCLSDDVDSSDESSDESSEDSYGEINRLQIYYNPTTGLVSRPPRVG